MLTDMAIKKAKVADRPYKLTDGSGLHLFVTPAGGKLWRLRYEFGGKEKLLSLGAYPTVSLLAARAAKDEAKAKLREGKDPGVAKKLRRQAIASSAATTFEAIATEWYDLNKDQWAVRHSHDVLVSLTRDVFPKLGSVPIDEITAPDVLALLRPIENRGAKETARRIRQRMSAVFVFAIASGRGSSDPAAVVKGAMAPMRKGRQPALTDLEQARTMLQKAESEPAHPVTKLALRILALTAVRPGTLASTPWSEWSALDKVNPVWEVPAIRMKLRLQQKDDDARNHLVPLSRQALEAIDALKLVSGRGALAFPNSRHSHKPMSENAMGYLLNRAGYHHKHVPHGWRSTFSSIMNERFRADHALIDLMLAHTQKDKVEGAYNRAVHLERRAGLAQIWADLILEGARPAMELLDGPRR